MKSQNKCRLKRQTYHLPSGLAATTHNMILLKLAGTKGSVLEMLWYTEIKV